MRAIVYIDAFNLYYSALKYSKNKWLDLEELAKAVMPNGCNIVKIKYFTAHVSDRLGKGTSNRQNIYLTALSSTPIVEIILGNYQVSKKWSGIVQPPKFKPDYTINPPFTLDVVKVYKTEEKGSDVNLGAHLLRDAAKDYFDIAGVITNDTDLCTPIEMVEKDFNKKVYLLSPTNTPAAPLTSIVHKVRYITGYLGPKRHFPDPVTLPNGTRLKKPQNW